MRLDPKPGDAAWRSVAATQTDTTHHIRARFLTRSFARIRATYTTSNAAHKGNPDEAEPSRGTTRAKKVHNSSPTQPEPREQDCWEMDVKAVQRVCQPYACQLQRRSAPAYQTGDRAVLTALAHQVSRNSSNPATNSVQLDPPGWRCRPMDSRYQRAVSVELAKSELFGRGVSSINQENLSKIPGAGDESRRPGSARGGAQRG